jgi:pyrimidine operon attenuation protein/uracil phosphoribosyltransferase
MRINAAQKQRGDGLKSLETAYVRKGMDSQRTDIMGHRQILITLDRIALEVCERHHSHGTLLLGGIGDRGFFLADLLSSRIAKFHGTAPELFRVDFDRIGFDASQIRHTPLPGFKDRNVLLVDDVLNSGKTLVHVMQPIISAAPSSLETIFLAERSYRSFPVRADYVGISLATTLQEHVFFDASNPEHLNLYLQ